MTPGLTDAITRDRFKSWAKVMKEQLATPVLAVAIGHGPNEGQVHVVVVKDVGNAELLRFLKHAVAELEGGGK